MNNYLKVVSGRHERQAFPSSSSEDQPKRKKEKSPPQKHG